MSKQRNTLRLDTSGFEKMIEDLDKLGGNVKKAVTDALQQAAETIRDDTIDALADSNLPAHGKYHSQQRFTEKSLIRDTDVHWDGDIGWVPVGFDFAKQGSGGYIITGTPRMKPDKELNRMYKQKKYMRMIQEGISDVLTDYIDDAMRN